MRYKGVGIFRGLFLDFLAICLSVASLFEFRNEEGFSEFARHEAKAWRQVVRVWLVVPGYERRHAVFERKIEWFELCVGVFT